MVIVDPTNKITPKLIHNFACQGNPYDNTAKSRQPVINKIIPTKAKKIRKKVAIITRLFHLAVLVRRIVKTYL